MSFDRAFLLAAEPVASLESYRDAGGGRGLETAHRIGPAETAAVVRASGLRGRGGAGFPTGIKWESARTADGTNRTVVCNAAEGEPGTFKDRALIRANPYQLIEGLAVAALAVGAERAFIAVKARFETERFALERASGEMGRAGLLGDLTVAIVSGPDDYLFGEETALLEVIEGADPLPRLYPPYVQGLFEGRDEQHPTVVNNVETLANVPHIVRNGSDWFRSFGTDTVPGTTVATIGGDVLVETVVEVEMGTPLSVLVYGFGGGLAPGRNPAVIANGVSNRPLTPDQLDVPMDFDSMSAAGSGYGSGGFTVYDDSVCVIQVAAALSRFLAEASCGQCPPCKLGSEQITTRFDALATGRGGTADVEEASAWALRVTDANRCGLGAGEQALARGVIDSFPEHLARHIGGDACPGSRRVVAPVIDDWDGENNRFRYREG